MKNLDFLLALLLAALVLFNWLRPSGSMANYVARELQTDFWTKIYQMARRVLDFGTFLGAVAYLIFGRKFRNEELGILLWPLTGLYIGSFFYVLTFLVFTSVKSWLRYIVIPLWCLIMLLMIGGLGTLAFTKGWKAEPAHAANPR